MAQIRNEIINHEGQRDGSEKWLRGDGKLKLKAELSF